MLKNIKFLSNNCDPLMYQDVKKSTFDLNLLQQIFLLEKSSDLTYDFLMTRVLQQHEHAELLVYLWS